MRWHFAIGCAVSLLAGTAHAQAEAEPGASSAEPVASSAEPVASSAEPDGQPAAPVATSSQDSSEAIRLAGLVQVDYQRLERSLDELGDGGREPLNEDQFLLRRARLRLNRDFDRVGLRAIGEFGGEEIQARPIAFDVHLDVTGDSESAILRAGLIPIPFGFENYGETDPQRFFGERTLFAHGLTPGRFDVGVSAEGHLLGVDWVVAVQNGQPVQAATHGFRDPNAAKDLAGRVRVVGDLVPGIRAAVASSVLVGKGFSEGTPPTKDSFEWRDLNEDGRVLTSELIPIPGSAGRASENFERWGLGADAQLWAQIPRLGELFLYGEVALAVNLDRAVAVADPVLFGRDQRSLGFYVAAIQEITEKATLGLRFEQYEPNADALELFGGMTVVTRRRFRTLTAAAAANLPLASGARARILAEYEAQKNSLGRDNQGRPAQLDNDTLRVRMELRF